MVSSAGARNRGQRPSACGFPGPRPVPGPLARGFVTVTIAFLFLPVSPHRPSGRHRRRMTWSAGRRVHSQQGHSLFDRCSWCTRRQWVRPAQCAEASPGGGARAIHDPSAHAVVRWAWLCARQKIQANGRRHCHQDHRGWFHVVAPVVGVLTAARTFGLGAGLVDDGCGCVPNGDPPGQQPIPGTVGPGWLRLGPGWLRLRGSRRAPGAPDVPFSMGQPVLGRRCEVMDPAARAVRVSLPWVVGTVLPRSVLFGCPAVR